MTFYDDVIRMSLAPWYRPGVLSSRRLRLLLVSTCFVWNGIFPSVESLVTLLFAGYWADPVLDLLTSPLKPCFCPLGCGQWQKASASKADYTSGLLVHVESVLDLMKLRSPNASGLRSMD